MAKASNRPPALTKPWTQPANNKRQKKLILSDQADIVSPSTKARSAIISRSKTSADSSSQRMRIDSLMECFAGVEDPRINRRRRHLLIDLIVISICAVICNADTWKDISIWGQTHQAWLGQFLELPNGIPTRDTLRRTISRINPEAFKQPSTKSQTRSPRFRCCSRRCNCKAPLSRSTRWVAKKRSHSRSFKERANTA